MRKDQTKATAADLRQAGARPTISSCIREVLARGVAARLGCVLLVPCIACQADEQAEPVLPESRTVIVEGSRIKDYRQEGSSVGKLTERLLDTPQSVSALTREEIDDRAFTAVNDALRSVPGISLGAGETSWQGTNLFLRGFTTRNDMFLDGMRDYGYYYRDPFNDTSIEVLKGPASILFGRGSTGGVIQQVSKAPTFESIRSSTLALGNADAQRATLDLGGAVPQLGASAAYRLNAMIHDSAVADRDGAATGRWGVAPSLALGLGTPTRFVASYVHQDDDIRPDYGLPWLAGRPAPVARENFYGFDSDYLDTVVDIGTLRLEHDFGGAAMLRTQMRYSRAKRRFRISEAVIPAGTPAGASLESIVVARNEFEGYSTDSFTQAQSDLTVRFTTGALTHTLVSGIEVGRESSNPMYVTNTGVPTTSLLDPLPQEYSATQSYPRLGARTRASTLGIYGLDTIKLGESWQAVLGVRWDQFESDYRSTGFSPAGDVIANTSHDQTDEAPSYRAALVYKPGATGTVYLGYADSFNPSAEGIESLISSGRALGQANLNLDPEASRTYELGTKWTLANGRALLTGSIFRIKKLNARVPDPTAPGFNALGGEQRVDGAEIELVGRPTGTWEVRGGYTLLDSETTRSARGGPRVGAPLLVTPEHTVSLWSQHRFTPALEAGVGALYVSSRLGQNTPASYLVAPGYELFDAMARYRVLPNLTVQLNVHNLTDKFYFDQLHPFHVVPGPGRTTTLSVRLDY